jgi:hypothetical protein
VPKVDITKIDRDFFGFSGLWSEFMDIRGHFVPSVYHLYGWYMDVPEHRSRVEPAERSSAVAVER